MIIPELEVPSEMMEYDRRLNSSMLLCHSIVVMDLIMDQGRRSFIFLLFSHFYYRFSIFYFLP